MTSPKEPNWPMGSVPLHRESPLRSSTTAVATPSALGLATVIPRPLWPHRTNEDNHADLTN